MVANSDDLIKELAGLDLTPQQAKAIAYTFTEQKMGDVYKKAGVSRTSYWRWSTGSPAFKRGLEIAKKEFLRLVAVEVRRVWIEAYQKEVERLVNGTGSRLTPRHRGG